MNKIWIGIGTAVAVLASLPVTAQVAQDFPNLKGPTLPIGGPYTVSRAGRTGNPVDSSPGQANLRWFTPNGAGTYTSGRVIDNTDVDPVATAEDGFPYPDNSAGYSIFDGTVWASPTLDQAAADAFDLPIRSQPDLVNGYPRNSSSRTPSYRYVRATNSASYANPTTAANPSSLKTFSWRFEPSLGPGKYALSVYIPTQPTTGIALQAGDTDPLGRVFSQQYYVYKITYGNNQSQIQIVDAYANTGWVRLGNGGADTNAVYDFDGTNPVTITLYNTVPRNSSQQVLLPEGATTSQSANNFLVYADAARATPAPGYYAATPTSARLLDGDINTTVVTAANNIQDVGVNGDTGEASSFSSALVSNYDFQTGNVRWTYSPVTESSATVTEDDSTATLAGAWIQDTSVPHQVGASPSLSLISSTGAADASANYDFEVPQDGSYAIYAYIPPNPGATYPLAQGARYEIETFNETDGTVVNTVVLNQETATGWVRLGGRFYHNRNVDDDSDTPLPLRIRVLNYSDVATDIGAKYVYADAIRVVGEAGIGVTSTPVHATALISKTRGAVPEETKVVFIADENGRIHCLDATGNGDGTTREYWAYPSYKDTEGYDPNCGPLTSSSNTAFGEDWSGPGNTPLDEREPTAAMPPGFDLSTAVVHRINVGTSASPVYRDRLYIGASNGRVYALDVTGRGDGDGTTDPVSGGTRTIGTTVRAWTYPATYPASSPVETSALGTFRGSLAVYDTNGAVDGGELIYAPASQGRMYALRALGDETTKTTTVEWAYPAINEPTLGSILNTPSVEFGNIYFGVNAKTDDATDQSPGAIYALNATTGDLAWTNPFFRTDDTSEDPLTERTDNFQSGVVTIPGTFLANGIDTVCALNENQVFYWINAATGDLLGATDELQGGSVGNLGFAMMNPYNSLGTISATQVPMVLVPLADGRLRAVRANIADTEVYGSHVGWGRDPVAGQMVASMANSNGWLYAADTSGYLRAYNNGSGLLVDGESPDSELITDNNPLGNRFRKAKVILINGTTFRNLRRQEGDPDRASYAEALAGAVDSDVMEWGQSLYLLVYDFPYAVENADGDPVDPPTVNVQFAFDGRNSRSQSVVARTFDTHVGASDEVQDATVPRFESVAPVGPLPDVTDNPRLNGFAIIPFPITSGGQNALPPGTGQAVVSISTASLNDNGALQSVALPPNVWYNGIESANLSWSRYPITVANPLAIIVPPSPTTTPSLTSTSDFSLGYVADPGGIGGTLRQEAIQNGGLDIAGSSKRENLLGTSTPLTGHGSTGKARLWVVDRSYMSLLRPGGVFGLDNVRLDRRDLAWQGGANAVIKPFDAAYTNFEDLPTNFPNTSLDYPNIRRERVKATKDPNGSAENPLFNGVALYAPRATGGGILTDSTPPAQRVFRPTPFEISVEVPKYQPANYLANLLSRASASVVGNSTASGTLSQQGYISRMNVFVDTTTNGALDLSQREAYRSFNVGAGVGVDERLRITTPIVDLGSLPGGAGVSPYETLPGTAFNPSNAISGQTSILQPWGGVFQNIFKPFGVVNDGNVNLLDVRIAKRSDVESGAGNVQPLSIAPDEGEPLSWLNGILSVHSDIDYQFSPSPSTRRHVIIQKPRVNDRVPTALRPNPVRRVNSNLGTTGTVGGVLDVANSSVESGSLKFPSRAPRIGVSVPIGYPVGRYTSQIIAFENLEGTTAPFDFWTRRSNFSLLPSGIQPYTNPGFTLTFNVVESRLTNSYTPLTAPQIDNQTPFSSSAQNTEKLNYFNTQPAATRDTDGNLILAYVSNRPTANATPGTDANRQPRNIYLATLNGSYTALPTGQLFSPLADLSAWAPLGDRWWRIASQFSSVGTSTDNPSFPTNGFVNPYTRGLYEQIPMAFTTRTTLANGQTQSYVGYSMVGVNEDGTASIGSAVINDNDPTVAKTETSVFIADNNTTPWVFYTGTTAGKSWVYYSRARAVSGGSQFGPTSPMPFGDGFLNTSGLSVIGRYRNNNPDLGAIAQFTFTGQLRGRPNAEVFRADAAIPRTGAFRLSEDADGLLQSDVFTPVSVVGDRIVREAAGVYRARGVDWSRTGAITLTQVVNGVSTDLLVASTRLVDRESSTISYECRLGGRVIFDTAQGLIRFTSAVPVGSANLYASYTAKFLRVPNQQSQVAGASKTTQLYDSRPIADYSYWHRGSDGAAVSSGNIRQDRFITMWNRAAGGGVSARPYVMSERFGLPLPVSKLATLPNGAPGYIDGSGNARPVVSRVQYLTPGGWVDMPFFEIDPSQGRLYFLAEFEGATVRTFYNVVDSQGNVTPQEYVSLVGIISERSEETIRIETAVNESSVTGFLDPAQSLGSTPRPPLVWLFWSSTRAGVSDIYFETIAPIWRPATVVK